MRVLHFIWSANFGGIEKLAIDLASQQLLTGQVQSAILIGCNKGQFLDLIEQKQIPYFVAGIKSGYHLSWSLISSITQKMTQYDIIHIHTFNLPVMIAAVQSGKKIIYTVHGNFNYGKKVRISDHINNLLKKYFFNNKVDFITFNSQWSQQEANNKFSIRKNLPFRIVSNGTEFGSNDQPDLNIKPEIAQKLKNKFVIGTVARFNQSKRIDRLIEAFAEFVNDNPESVLMLVGDGIERPVLERLVTENDISDKVIFTGYQSNVKPYQRLMDVCVFPFQNEAFGLVILESYALGKPVIIFGDSGGMLEIHGDQFRDDVVHNRMELVTRLHYYYQRRSETDQSAVQKRIAIASSYTLEKMEQEYLACYQLLSS